MSMNQTRRRFLGTLSLAGAMAVLGAPRVSAAEGPLETTSLRLFKYPGICVAPHHIAEDLLRAEGLTEIRYVPEDPARRPGALARAKVDFGMDFATSWVSAIDRGAGRHVRGRKDRCSPRISARSAGFARPTDQERRGYKCLRSPVVAIFLLHVGGQ